MCDARGFSIIKGFRFKRVLNQGDGYGGLI